MRGAFAGAKQIRGHWARKKNQEGPDAPKNRFRSLYAKYWSRWVTYSQKGSTIGRITSLRNRWCTMVTWLTDFTELKNDGRPNERRGDLWEGPMSVIVFPQDLKASCVPCESYEGVTFWLFRHYCNGSAEAPPKSLVPQTNSFSTRVEGALRAFSKAVHLLLNREAVEKRFANLEDDVRSLRRGKLVSAVLVHQLWSKTPSCWSISADSVLNAILDKG